MNEVWALGFGLVSSLCFGISNAYWKSASKTVDQWHLIIFRGIFASAFFVVIWIASDRWSPGIPSLVNSNADFLDFVLAIALCLICSLGLIFFLKSLKLQNVSLTIPFTSVNIFNILTTVFIVGESFKTVYYFSFSAALIGMLLLANYTFGKVHWNQAASYAILASFFWGITYPLFKFVSPTIGAIPLSLILEGCVTFIACVRILLFGDKIFSKDSVAFRNLKHYLILTLLLVGGTFSFNVSIQTLSVLYLNLLGNLQMLISILIGVMFFREDLSRKQVFGILFIFASILVPQLF